MQSESSLLLAFALVGGFAVGVLLGSVTFNVFAGTGPLGRDPRRLAALLLATLAALVCGVVVGVYLSLAAGALVTRPSLGWTTLFPAESA